MNSASLKKPSRLRLILQQRGLSSEVFAAGCGLSKSLVLKLMSGHIVPSANTIEVVEMSLNARIWSAPSTYIDRKCKAEFEDAVRFIVNSENIRRTRHANWPPPDFPFSSREYPPPLRPVTSPTFNRNNPMANNTTAAQKRPAPVAKRIIEFSHKLKGTTRLSPALVKELDEIARDTAAYLKDRSSFVQSISVGADANRIEKIEAEILQLEAKSNKDESSYSRLAVLERMVQGMRKEGESATIKAEKADALLKAEIQGFRQPLISALSINVIGGIRAKAVKAIEPFLLGQDPDQYVLGLPAVQDSHRPFQKCMRSGPFDTGVTDAEEICNLIEKWLAGEL